MNQLAHMVAYVLTETEAACMGPAWVCIRSSTYMLWLLAWNSFPSVALSSLCVRAFAWFCYILFFFFCLVFFFLLEACSFWKERKGSGSSEEGGEGELGETQEWREGNL